MSRRFANLTRFLGNYGYYRKQGLARRQAWNLASRTLP